jgi:hypothetical protein
MQMFSMKYLVVLAILVFVIAHGIGESTFELKEALPSTTGGADDRHNNNDVEDLPDTTTQTENAGLTTPAAAASTDATSAKKDITGHSSLEKLPHWSPARQSWECSSLSGCAAQPDPAEAKAEKAIADLEEKEASQKNYIKSLQAESESTRVKLQRAKAAARQHNARGAKKPAGAAISLVETRVRSESVDCVDKQPPSDWAKDTCAKQKAAGHCEKSWFHAKGYCKKTCGTCATGAPLAAQVQQVLTAADVFYDAATTYNASTLGLLFPSMPNNMQDLVYTSADDSICLNTTNALDPCIENVDLGTKKYATFMLDSHEFGHYLTCNKYTNGTYTAPLSCTETSLSASEPNPIGREYLAAFDPREDTELKTSMENGTVTIPGIKIYATFKKATDEVISFTQKNVNSGALIPMEGMITYRKLSACFAVVWNMARTAANLKQGRISRGANCVVKKSFKVTHIRTQRATGAWNNWKPYNERADSIRLHFDITAAQIV